MGPEGVLTAWSRLHALRWGAEGKVPWLHWLEHCPQGLGRKPGPAQGRPQGMDKDRLDDGW